MKLDFFVSGAGGGGGLIPLGPSASSCCLPQPGPVPGPGARRSLPRGGARCSHVGPQVPSRRRPRPPRCSARIGAAGCRSARWGGGAARPRSPARCGGAARALRCHRGSPTARAPQRPAYPGLGSRAARTPALSVSGGRERRLRGRGVRLADRPGSRVGERCRRDTRIRVPQMAASKDPFVLRHVQPAPPSSGQLTYPFRKPSSSSYMHWMRAAFPLL